MFSLLRIACLATLLAMVASCTTTPSSSSNTFVRISNQSGVALNKSEIGRRIIKGNSYSNTNYISDFGKLNDGDVTDYCELKESYFGVERFLVSTSRGGYTRMTRYQPVDARNFQEALKLNSGIEVKEKHPYSRKEQTGYVLPKGRYTFTITLDESIAQQKPCLLRPGRVACERGFILEIRKDDDGS